MNEEPGKQRRLPRTVAALAGLVTFVLLWWVDVSTSYPPPEPVLQLQLQFPTGIPNRGEPIITTGYTESGTYLFVTYLATNSAVLTYQVDNLQLNSQPFTFEPGFSYPCRIELPAIANAGQSASQETGTVSVSLNGITVLQNEMRYHPCSPRRIFFGENPNGGSTCGMVFRGAMKTATGEQLTRYSQLGFSTGRKLGTWAAKSWWHVFPLLGLSAGAAWVARYWYETRILRRPLVGQRSRNLARAHGWFIAAATVNVILFAWLMTGGKFRFIYPDAFGAFYHIQAESLLQGRLDVAAEALGGEAFVANGKAYAYFGLTPALIRLPFALLGIHTQVASRVFMLAEFAGCLLGAYLLFGHATRLLRGAAERPAGWAVAIMVTATGAGSTLLFLGSRVYVYHEAILCGIALAVISTYFSLRYLAEPRPRWWLWALLCGILSVHSRPTTGLFALGVLGWIAAARLVSNRRNMRAWREPLAIGALACAGFLSLNAIAYLKFQTFNAAPHHLNVQYSKERIARIDGRNFHLANVSHNVGAYLLAPAFHTVARFPYFIFEQPRPDVSAPKMDLREPVVSILFSMAGLVFLALTGLFSALKAPSFRPPLLVVALASVPIFGGMLMFIATSHRYTADFSPALITTAAFGLAFIAAQTKRWRTLLLAAASAATMFAAALTLGLSFHFQAALVWGVPEEVKLNYMELQKRTDRWFGTAPR